jgi:predicted glutamine amidotransferase
MCRWIAYVGDAVYLEDFVSLPRQSLVVQSHHARESKSDVNGDGFGIGWYGERERPGVFRDIRPAWSDDNLLSISHQIRSRLFVAHVRASTGTASTRSNCHPFSVGPWLFMHNGQIGGYERIKRRLEREIPDDLYAHRNGTTDSEILFLLLLANGFGQDPLAAFHRTLCVVQHHMRDAGIAAPLRMTAAITKGDAIWAIRFASDGQPPTLYTKLLADSKGMLVVSEPLDGESEGWIAVPPQRSRQGVSITAALKAVSTRTTSRTIDRRGTLDVPMILTRRHWQGVRRIRWAEISMLEI